MESANRELDDSPSRTNGVGSERSTAPALSSPAMVPQIPTQRDSKEVQVQTGSNVQHDDEPSEHGEDPNYVDAPFKIEHLPAPKKKKKKKSRPQSKRGLNAPTGFEEFHAEVLTPAEAAEDTELYSSDLSFITRILTAIQRFERTRKLSSERRNIFYKYLAYGGVDVGPNMFQSGAGLDWEKKEDLKLDQKKDWNSEKKEDFDLHQEEHVNKPDLAAALSQASINDDKNDLTSDERLYDVDFEGCMKSFLSRKAVHIQGFETQESVKLVTTTMERFMDYLLQHEVCPEYKTQVLTTRDLCREASSDLWSCAEAGRWLPGDFNIACSTLFGGQYARDYDGETSWEPDNSGRAGFVGFKPELALQIVKFGIAGAASEQTYRSFIEVINDMTGTKQLSVIETIPNAGFEITSIEPPTKACIQIYRSQSSNFRPVGRIHAKPWLKPDAPPEDVSPPTSPSLRTTNPTGPAKNETYTFLIESSILNLLHVGTKLIATIHKLNVGIHYFDEFQTCLPAWDEYCEENEFMIGWKKPRWVEGSVPWHEEQEKKVKEEMQRAEQELQEESDQEEDQPKEETEEGNDQRNGNTANEASIPST